MLKHIRVTITAALLVMALGGSASATHGGIHPTFRNETNYFTCLEANRVQNIPRNQSEALPGWSTTAPTQALEDGGGCVQYENILTSTATTTGPDDLAIGGTFTGNLKTLTIELYLANVSSFGALDQYMTDANLYIDGELIHTAAEFTFDTVAAGDALDKFTFSYTKLDKLFATEDADGTQEREIVFSMSSYNEQQCFWAWGATDAPGKINVNPATAAPMKFAVA